MTEQTTIPEADEAAPITQALESVNTQIAAFSKIGAGIGQLTKDHPPNLACNVATPAGMKEAIAGRAAWRQPRIDLENMRKAAKAPVLALGKLIDTTAAGIEAQLRIGESNYDDQIQAELTRKAEEKAKAEEAERVRVQQIKDLIAKRYTSRPARLFGSGSIAIKLALDEVDDTPMEPSLFGEFMADAQSARAHAMEALQAMLDTQKATEERAAEQKRIAAEQAAQAAALTEQRAAFEREQQAHRDELERKAAALKAEADAREAAARAEREKVEAAQRADRERIAAEQKALDDAKRAEADRLAAIERKRLDDEAAAARAEADRLRVEADNKAAEERAAQQKRDEAERKRIAKAAAKLEAVQKAGPALLAAIVPLIEIAMNAPGGHGEAIDNARAAVAEAEGGAE